MKALKQFFESSPTMPRHLKIVGWAFVFVGFMALIQTLYTLLNRPMVNIDFLIVFLFVGFGLLKKKPLWRTFALSCSMVVLVLLVGNLLLILFGQKNLGQAPAGVIVTFWVKTILGVAASTYALWALQTKEVVAAFGPPARY